jgi:hypothetical protein
MSHQYDTYSYEYVNDGNHDDDGYDKSELYSEFAEPDHWEPKPTPFEPNHHAYDYVTDPTKYNNTVEPNRDVDEVYQPQRSEYEGDDIHEHRELAYSNDKTGEDWEGGCRRDVEGYERRALKYEGNGIHELQELEYAGNELYELQELEHGEHEVHELRELAYHEDEAQELRELTLMYDKWGHEPPASLYNEHGDTSRPTHVHAPTTPSPPCLPIYDDGSRYTRTPTYPYSHPPCTLPSTRSPTRPSLNASESRDHIEPEDHAHTPSLYSNLDKLCHKYNLGIPSAIAYMQGLQEYTEECLREQEEWNVDQRAEIRQNHNISYPKRDYLNTPRSWDAINKAEHHLPHTIESSRPLGQASKRRHYRNTCTPRYHMSQPRPPRVPRPPPELDSDLGPGIPPPPTTLSNKYHSYNNSPKPMYHANPSSTPYSPARLCPPPWPNKNQNPNKNRHKYYYGTHPLAGTPAKQ